jgi:predicted permease
MLERFYRRILTALRSFVRRRAADRELDDELQFHLEQMQELAVQRGDNPSDARRRARQQMGSVEPVKEACRDVRPLRPVEHFLHDLRFGARLLARGRGFTVTAVVSLALGIGASSSIFSLINAIVLRPLPVAAAHELHIAQVIEPDEIDLLFSSAVVQRASSLLAGQAEIAAQSTTESALIATPGGTAPPQAARLQLVAGDFFGTLRQRAQIGRLLGPGDNRSVGQHPVVVISDRYWRRQFDGAARALDTELIVNGTRMTVVGVAAPGFFGATLDREPPDLWAPAAMQAPLRFAGNYERSGGDLQQPWPSQPEFSWLQVMLRVPQGGEAAASGAMTVAERAENPPGSTRATRALPVTLARGAGGFSPIRSDLMTPLFVLLLMVGLLLTIACANIAGLLLARAMSRGREIAIRLSMGAGRGRVIRQLLTESLLLAVVGGTVGMALAYWGSAALLMLLTHGQPASGVDVTPDWRVVSVTFAISIATALAFGLLPALRGTRLPLADTLKAQTRGVVGTGRQAGRLPLGDLLIAGQMAVAVLLLLVAVLFARSLQALTRVDVGFDRDHLLVARIDPRSAGYGVAELPALAARVGERLGRLPGVTAVSLSTNGPFSGSRSRGHFQIEGYIRSPGDSLFKNSEWVTSDYFRTVGLPITQGRGFGPEDSARSRRVSVINETMARRYFPGQNPIGRRWGNSGDFNADGIEIVGVVKDARYDDLKDESVSMSYQLAVQNERYLRSIEVRTSGRPSALAGAVRQALRESEPRLAVGPIETLDERVVRSIRVERLLGWLTMTFAAAALGLACLGLYGTISYAIRRRTAELGIRIALGADRAAVQWLIVRGALLLVLAGAAIGLPLALLAARAVGGLLYATDPFDPAAPATALAVLAAVATLAAYIPARRASRLDPMAALRSE